LLQGEPSIPDPETVSALGVAFGAVLATAGLAVVPFASAFARRLWPERNVFFARWGFTHLAGLIAVFVFVSLGQAFLWPAPEEGEFGLLESLARMSIIFAVAALLIRRYAVELEPEPARALGFGRGGNLRAVGIGVAVYLMLLPALMGVTFFWPSLLQLLGQEVEAQAVLTGFLDLDGRDLALAFIGATLVIPFFEELIFRGFLQPLLVQNFRDKGGVVLTSVIFGALHGSTAFLPIFALSLILGGVMLRTRRLAGAFAIHALHNGLMITLALNVPEMAEVAGEAGLLGLLLP
jgi:membrane protease YdiL (CAAX protease family)